MAKAQKKYVETTKPVTNEIASSELLKNLLR